MPGSEGSQTAAILTIIIVNLILTAVVYQISADLPLPGRWSGYYQHTTIWMRTLVAGLIYASVIYFWVHCFKMFPTVATFTQVVMNVAFLAGIPVLMHNRELTPHLKLAVALSLVVGLYLAWAIETAPAKSKNLPDTEMLWSEN